MAVISVIIPCYNQGRYIDDAVYSVLNQSYQDFEIIIVNDGSTDRFTNDLLKSYNRPKCTVVHTRNKGLAAARNAGLKLATGDYIQFLDADDILHSEKFEIQIKRLRQTSKYSLAYCDYFTSTEFNLKEEFPARYLSPQFRSQDYVTELICSWEKEMSIPCHCFLFSSSIFKNTDILFDEELPNHEDWECWMKVFALKPEVSYFDQKLATYRIRSTAMSFDRSRMHKGFVMALNKQVLRFAPKSLEFKLLLQRRNEVYYGYGSDYIIISFLLGSFIKIINGTKRFLRSALILSNA